MRVDVFRDGRRFELTDLDEPDRSVAVTFATYDAADKFENERVKEQPEEEVVALFERLYVTLGPKPN